MNVGFLMAYAPKQMKYWGDCGWCYRCILDEEYHYACIAVGEGREYDNCGTAGVLS